MGVREALAVYGDNLHYGGSARDGVHYGEYQPALALKGVREALEVQVSVCFSPYLTMRLMKFKYQNRTARIVIRHSLRCTKA